MEYILPNIYFCLSLLTTIYYWIRVIFLSRPILPAYGLFGFCGIQVLLTCQLLDRWIQSQHFPLSGLYESLLILAWGLCTVYIVIEVLFKQDYLGIIIAPCVLLLIGFTEFALPDELQTVKPLVPALQSNWLCMHVSVMMASYASLIVGSVLAIVYIIASRFWTEVNSASRTIESSKYLQNTESFDKQKILQVADTKNISLNKFNDKKHFLSNEEDEPVLLMNSIPQFETNSIFLNKLDNMSYRLVGIGFCFLTLGIISGAVWANETWGTYWSWDPKETWALITWLLFAVYLHTRLVYGWDGWKSALIGSIGFLSIWMCYLGVNIAGQGLHSYGFLS